MDFWMWLFFSLAVGCVCIAAVLIVGMVLDYKRDKLMTFASRKVTVKPVSKESKSESKSPFPPFHSTKTITIPVDQMTDEVVKDLVSEIVKTS